MSWPRGCALLCPLGCAVLLACALSCDEEEAQSTAEQFCADAAERLRGCGLLSEGELRCGLLLNERYVECVRPCFEAASCEDFRAQACDDADNELGLCIDRCQYEAATFDCGDGTRIDPDDRCDDVPDCASGADEQRCDELPVQAVFDCADGQRVLDGERCDGALDCADGSDEAGCPMRAMTLCPGGF